MAQILQASPPNYVATLGGLNPQLWISPSVTPIDKIRSTHEVSYLAKMEALCMQLQGFLCRLMEEVDGNAKYYPDKWDREAGGGGISCIMQNGAVFEKAGVNISFFHGIMTPESVNHMRTRLKKLQQGESYNFSVCGISCVVHPLNPHVPTMHFNFRYFEVEIGNGETMWWFGGGIDLTPYYLYEEDTRHFHNILKEACERQQPGWYNIFKRQCDEYFVIKHRNEGRGIGGIFFDDLDQPSQSEVFAFIQSCVEAVAPAYLTIVARRKDLTYTEEEKEWQLVRRGRYAEFNLVYDRGTKFGLTTHQPRIESILMSLPPNVKWVYSYDTSKDPRHLELIDVLQNPRDWAT